MQQARTMLIATGFVLAMIADGLWHRAAAGDIYGPVDELLVGADGGLYVNVDGTYNGRPSCSGQTRLFVDDSHTSGHRNLHAAFLASLHSGHPVNVIGTGVCKGTAEVVGYIHAFGAGPHP
jgi:hypothetical protein